MQTNAAPFAPAACPYLGMRDDPATCYGYPSAGNYCSYCQPPAVPLLEHQGSYCLSQGYKGCPAIAGPPGGAFPLAHRLKVRARRAPKLRTLALALGLAVLAFAGWQALPFLAPARPAPANLAPAPATLPEASLPALVPVTGSPTSAPTPLPPSPAAPRTAAPAPSAAPGPVRALEVPIQVDGRTFLIHRVLAGESFESLERAYETSTEVILATNYFLTSPLWANSLVVLAPGARTVDPEMPAFQAYQVNAQESSLAELARQFQVDPALLAYYNPCPDPCRLQAGDWLLVPRVRETPFP